jgi:hypothetical protein
LKGVDESMAIDKARVNAILEGLSSETLENVPASEGGCWYCEKVDGQLAFAWSFDTNVHLACLEAAIKADPTDAEARIMGEELVASTDATT